MFTTLKYFRSQRPLFESKLLEYAATLGETPGQGQFRFQYVAIVKARECFEAIPVANFRVDLSTGRIEEETLWAEYSYGDAAPFSHIKETTGYGSYVPKAATTKP